jgi:hypothetical protein
MLDIQVGSPGPHRPPPIHNPEFVRIELAPMADGRVMLSMTATMLDEDDPQLLDQEIARLTVATIDDVLALIRAHVRLGAVAPRLA